MTHLAATATPMAATHGHNSVGVFLLALIAAALYIAACHQRPRRGTAGTPRDTARGQQNTGSELGKRARGTAGTASSLRRTERECVSSTGTYDGRGSARSTMPPGLLPVRAPG